MATKPRMVGLQGGIPLVACQLIWMTGCIINHDRTHQGKMCCGRTPMQTLIDGKEVWNDKITLLNN